jgi:sulfide:quinone oxidoreductase
MRRAPRPLHVIVAGGGVAAIETLLALRALTGDALGLTLVTPEEYLRYRPLAVVEPPTARPARRYRLDELCADLGVELCRDTLASVDGTACSVTTADGERVAYDALVLATDARAHPSLAHAQTLLADGAPRLLDQLVRGLEEGSARRVAFVVPPRSGWSLPAYELALLTAARAQAHGVDDAQLVLVTPEDAPLALFHGAGSAAVGGRLACTSIALCASTYAERYDGRTLSLRPAARTQSAERVVALPTLAGPRITGVPSDREGFVHVDDHGRVPGRAGIYAVGSATTFPVKQDGLAAQQADTVATVIARTAGVQLADPPTRPVVRAVIFTGTGALYLRATLAGGEGAVSTVSRRCPWWPPHLVAARRLAAYLADRDHTPVPVARDCAHTA